MKTLHLAQFILALLVPAPMLSASIQASPEALPAAALADADDPTDAPIRSMDVIVADVRVHLLSSDHAPLNSRLTDQEVREAFRGVNEVWEAAGIQWRIESIIREPAANAGLMREAPPGPGQSSVLQQVMPREHVTDHLWHVFFVREIGAAPGVYVSSIPAVIQAEVDPWGMAGLEGELVRVLAHELGHSLGLAHVPCVAEGNLMSAGCDSENRTRLTEIQIEVAREQAASGLPFTGNPFPSDAIGFLLAHDHELELEAGQRAVLQEMAEAYIAAVTPLRESSRELSQAGMRQMQSGVSDPSAARERQRQLQEIMREVGAVEREMLDSALESLRTEQREAAQRLLDRRAVMMGGG